jgi:hypothetical protein
LLAQGVKFFHRRVEHGDLACKHFGPDCLGQIASNFCVFLWRINKRFKPSRPDNPTYNGQPEDRGRRSGPLAR